MKASVNIFFVSRRINWSQKDVRVSVFLDNVFVMSDFIFRGKNKPKNNISFSMSLMNTVFDS